MLLFPPRSRAPLRVCASTSWEATGARVLARGWNCPASTDRREGRDRSKREAIKMPVRRPERKTRRLQISWACGIILIKIIDSYCTCENEKKIDSNPHPTNRLELLDGARRGCDLGSDLVPGFPIPSAWALLFIICILLVSLGPGWRRSQRLQVSEGLL